MATETDTASEIDGDLLRHLVLDFRQMTQFAEAPWIFTRARCRRSLKSWSASTPTS